MRVMVDGFPGTDVEAVKKAFLARGHEVVEGFGEILANDTAPWNEKRDEIRKAMRKQAAQGTWHILVSCAYAQAPRSWSKGKWHRYTDRLYRASVGYKAVVREVFEGSRTVGAHREELPSQIVDRLEAEGGDGE